MADRAGRPGLQPSCFCPDASWCWWGLIDSLDPTMKKVFDSRSAVCRKLLVVFGIHCALTDQKLLHITDGAEGGVLDFLGGGFGEVNDFADEAADSFAGFLGLSSAFGRNKGLKHLSTKGVDADRANQ